MRFIGIAPLGTKHQLLLGRDVDPSKLPLHMKASFYRNSVNIIDMKKLKELPDNRGRNETITK